VRPESLPTYEVLYKTAEELAAKRDEMRRAAEAAKLRVRRVRCSNGPADAEQQLHGSLPSGNEPASNQPHS